MDTITSDQFYAVFGDIRTAQRSQATALEKLNRIVSESVEGLASQVSSMQQSIEKYATETFNLAKTLDKPKPERKDLTTKKDLNDQQRKIEQTISAGIKTISSTVLTREDLAYLDQRSLPDKKVKKVEMQRERPSSKHEKLLLKEQQLTNTKLGLLTKEIQSAKEPKQGSGILKVLAPFLLIFGSIAALAYGMLKIPGARQMVESLKKGRIGTTLTGLINKIKPQEKTITEWLRGLPFIGSFFNIYDAFTAFFKGNYKEGLKHLSLLVPGAEMILQMIGVSKQQYLAPGGLTKAREKFSFKKIYDGIVQGLQNAFASITDFFKHIKDSVMPMMSGTWEGITSGLSNLAYYFPVLQPVVNFVQGLTDDIFSSSIADLARSQQAPDQIGPINLGDIITTSISEVYNKISRIIGEIGRFFGAIGNIFSSDYGKQSQGFAVLDEYAPGLSDTLRSVFNIVDTLKQFGLKQGDSVIDVIRKIAFTGFTPSDKYSRAKTTEESQKQLTQEIDKLPPGSTERKAKEDEKRRQQLAAEELLIPERTEKQKEKIRRDYTPASTQEGYDAQVKETADKMRSTGRSIFGVAGGEIFSWFGTMAGHTIAMVDSATEKIESYTGLIDIEQKLRIREEKLKEADIEAQIEINKIREERKKLQEPVQPTKTTAAVVAPAEPTQLQQAKDLPLFDFSLLSDPIKQLVASTNKMSDRLSPLTEVAIQSQQQTRWLENISLTNQQMSQQNPLLYNFRGGPVVNNFGASIAGSPGSRSAFSTP